MSLAEPAAPDRSRRLSWPLAAAVAANLAMALAVWTRQPWAGGPAEWRWEYLAAGGTPGGAAAGGGGLPLALLLASLGALASIGAIGAIGTRRGASSRGAAGGPGAARRWVLPLAVALGTAFTFALVAWQPGGFAREMAALVSRNSFGYVWDAALAPASRELLADYPAASAGLNQHSVTHPPGPILLVRGLDALGGAGGGTLVGLAAAAIDREVQQARRHGRPLPPVPPHPRTVAILAVLLPALSALAAWPLHGLAMAWGGERRIALLAAVLWLLVPARSLFTPSLDQALPLLLVGAAWLAALGGRWRAAAAGALLFAACFLSYGCLAVVPLVAVGALAGSRRDGDRRQAASVRQDWLDRRPWRAWLPMALGLCLPYLLLAVIAGHDPWHAMRAALALHHRIAVEPRSYLTWLLWDPYDFALLLSPAVLGLAAAAAATSRRTRWRIVALAWWGLLAALLLSGSVRGEAGRIWMMWMPFACLFAAASGRDAADGPEARRGMPAPGAALLLASQGALVLALAARMSFVG